MEHSLTTLKGPGNHKVTSIKLSKCQGWATMTLQATLNSSCANLSGMFPFQGVRGMAIPKVTGTRLSLKLVPFSGLCLGLCQNRETASRGGLRLASLHTKHGASKEQTHWTEANRKWWGVPVQIPIQDTNPNRPKITLFTNGFFSG